MEARIRQLRHLIDNAEVRESSDSGLVEVGSVVRAVDEDGDEMKFFVAPQENKAPGYIMASPESPLGGALLGAAEGEEVTYQAPGGTFTSEGDRGPTFRGMTTPVLVTARMLRP